MHVCRECEVVLWRRLALSCPSCCARSPRARVVAPQLTATRTLREQLAVLVAGAALAVPVVSTAPVAAVDHGLTWLVGAASASCAC